MKKGFTLVELLAVIIIIGVVALIAVPAVMENIKESREQLYTVQVQNIELAAKKWATDSIDELDTQYLNSSFVSVKMLQDLGYLPKEELHNPVTDETMAGCVEISYDFTGKTYSYNYDDENADCIEQDKSGYYYQKSLDNVWQKDTTKQKESIFSYLVGEDNANIVATGSGLYDMGDRYVFRGNVTNNYVSINGNKYRILSLDKNTKSMKLIETSNSGSAEWGNSDNTSFNASTLYTGSLNKSLYPTITNTNIKWNIGKLENTDSLNLNTIKTYEAKTQIVSELGLISMSEYMEASINLDCSNGVLTSCGVDNYLNIADSWTTTTTASSVAFIGTNGILSYETDLGNAHHNIYRVLNVVNMEKSGTGTSTDPFSITTQES